MSRAVSITLSMPGATTSVMGASPASSALRTTCPTIGMPATGCSTFGRVDFIRVPLPAARTMAAVGIVAFFFIMAGKLL